jgi:hypothetical protein
MKIGRIYSNLYLVVLAIATLWGLGWIALGAHFSYPNAEDLGIAARFAQFGIKSQLSNMLIYNDGRFSTNIIHGISPIVWRGYNYYPLLPMFSILLLWVALFVFLKSLFIEVNHTEALIYSGATVISLFSVLISVSSTIYCWGGTLVYIFPCSFTLLWMGFVVLYLKTSKSLFFVFSTLCLFISTGFNEMFLALTPVLLILVLLYTYLFEKSKLLPIFSATTTGISGVCLMILSPGSSHKIDSNFSIVDRLLDFSFWSYFSNQYLTAVGNFYTHLPVWTLIAILMLVIAPAFYKKKVNQPELFFLSLASVVVIITTIFMALIFFLPMADLGHPQERVFTPIYITLFVSTTLLLSVSVPYFSIKITRFTQSTVTIFLSIVFVFGLILTDGNFNSIKREYLSGEIQTFAQKMEDRFTMFESAKRQNTHWKKVMISEINRYPKTIYYPTEPMPNMATINWNLAYEEYFKLDEILLSGDTISKF